MGRHCTDHIVDFEALHNLQSDDAQAAAYRADDYSPLMCDNVGTGRDRHQACDGPIQTGEQIDPSEKGAGQKNGGYETRGPGKVGISKDITDRYGIDHAAQSQLRAPVETEPAEPQDEDAQRHDGHIRRCGHLDLTVLSEFTLSCADDKNAGERRPAAGRVNDSRSGKILEAHFIEPSAAPCPGPDDRVDDRRQHGNEDKEGPQFDTLGQCTGYDGGGRPHKHHLEEPVRHYRTAII